MGRYSHSDLTDQIIEDCETVDPSTQEEAEELAKQITADLIDHLRTNGMDNNAVLLMVAERFHLEAVVANGDSKQYIQDSLEYWIADAMAEVEGLDFCAADRLQ